MATAESVKIKIQALINKGNTVTGKDSADLSSVVDELIEGYSEVLVDVDALPAENIDQSKIYRVTSGTETTYGIPDETKKLYVFKGGVETKTFAVDDTFPRYTPAFAAGVPVAYAKVSDIIFDDLTEYLKDEYTVEVVSSPIGPGEISLSSMEYYEDFKSYFALDVVIVSNDDSVLGFGTTGVFVLVEAEGEPCEVNVTLPIFTGGWVEVGAGGDADGKPITVTTSEEMDAVLANATEADIGKFYLYTGGESDKYENDAVYKIE